MSNLRQIRHFPLIAGILFLAIIVPPLMAPEIVFGTILTALFYGFIGAVDMLSRPIAMAPVGSRIVLGLVIVSSIIGAVTLLVLLLAKQQETEERGLALTERWKSDGEIPEWKILAWLGIPALIVTLTWVPYIAIKIAKG